MPRIAESRIAESRLEAGGVQYFNTSAGAGRCNVLRLSASYPYEATSGHADSAFPRPPGAGEVSHEFSHALSGLVK